MQYSPGSPAEFTTTVTNASGQPVNADSVEVDIFDPDAQVLDNGVPELVSTGFYRFVYDVPADAQFGLWRINWKITRNGITATGDEYFDVVDPEIIVNPSGAITQSQLRARLGEPKSAPTTDGSETFFTDTEIVDLLAYAGDSLDLATLEGWRRKMARYARLVDVTESGSDRKMRQKFQNAKDMVAFWTRFNGDVEEALQSGFRGSVVGRPVNLRNNGEEALQTPFSGYSDHVREYPTHRLLIPAILS